MPEAATLVVLPGLDGIRRLGLPLQACLPPAIEVVYLDFPCHEYRDLRQLEPWLRDRLPDRAPQFLLAQSYSTPLAVALAQAQPTLRGLILVAPLQCRRPRPGLIAALRRTPAGILRLPPPRFAVRWLLLGRDAPRELVDDFRRSVRDVTPRVLAARLRELAELLAMPRTMQAPCPILCLHGAHDRLLTGPCPRPSDDPAELVRHRTIDGPHLLLARRPQAVAEAVAAFIAERTS